MNPIPLRNSAVPSSTVLNFLRSQVHHAFEAPTARCAALRGPGRRPISTCARVGVFNIGARGSCAANAGSGGWVKPQAYSPSSSSHPNSRRHFPALNALRNRTFSPSSTLDCPVSPLSSHRAFSTSALREWRLWPSKRRPRSPSVHAPKPPLSSLMEDSGTGLYGLGRTARQANELKMRCTELDEHGNVTMVSGEFKKSELIAKVR